MSSGTVEAAALAALLCADPSHKCLLTQQLAADWATGRLGRTGQTPIGRVETPGRPILPRLVEPVDLPRRNAHSPLGHAALLHAVAHIEFNAINLALDCALRFSARGDQFVTEWLQVAREESEHYALLAARLADFGCKYGDFDAHDGLWEMALRTDHDFLARMALVPRLLEARGLDATPPILQKLREIGDQTSAAILERILHDEIGHVTIGDYWFKQACVEQNLAPEATYLDLIVAFVAPPPRPPLNRQARLQAGFSDAELAIFEERAGRRAAWGFAIKNPA